MTRGPVDIEALRRGHQQFIKWHVAEIAEALYAAGEVAKEHVRTESDFKQRSGPAKSAKTTTRARIVRMKGGGLLTVQAPAKHATWLEKGTDPHVIRPRRAKALRFTSSSGNTVFRRSVNHPGTQPTWFLRNAAEAASSALGAHLRVRMNRLAERFKTLK